jgi:hypothetical protein
VIRTHAARAYEEGCGTQSCTGCLSECWQAARRDTPGNDRRTAPTGACRAAARSHSTLLAEAVSPAFLGLLRGCAFCSETAETRYCTSGSFDSATAIAFRDWKCGARPEKPSQRAGIPAAEVPLHALSARRRLPVGLQKLRRLYHGVDSESTA